MSLEFVPIAAKGHQPDGLVREPETRLVHVDKIASATGNQRLAHDLEIVAEAIDGSAPRPGDIVVVRTLTDNATYNTLELVSGRMARVNRGDVVAGVLGYRRALKGFVGDVPDRIAAGDKLHLLNLGGLVGRCLGHHHSLSDPIQVEVLGMAVRDGRILNISQGAIKTRDTLDVRIPLILIAGTCMNSGKTYAATAIIKHLTQAGLKVAAAKLTGVACLRDTLNMEDHGAVKTMSFLDCGLPSTVGVSNLAPIAKGLISRLAEIEPACVVIELGDGIIGGYSVDTVFDDSELMNSTAALVFCANDFVGAWGGRELLSKRGVRVDVVSGPVTDSQMGIEYVESQLGLVAANAVNQGERLAGIIKERLAKW